MRTLISFCYIATVNLFAAAATCAWALLYLHCANHKEESGPGCVYYLQTAPTSVQMKKLHRTLQIKEIIRW